jgi:LEA14-like dessication related protein
MKKLLTLLLSGAFLIIVGCAGPGGASLKPTVELQDVRVGGFDRDGVDFTVTLRVFNPNIVDIPLEDLTADIKLSGQLVATAKAAQSKYRLTAQQAISLPLTARVEFKTLPEVLRQSALAIVSGGLRYDVTGSATTGNGLIPLRFKKEGTLQSPRR